MAEFDDLVTAFISLHHANEYDDSQARADDGKWTDGGGGSSGKHSDSNAETKKRYTIEDGPTASLTKMVINDAKLPDVHTDGLVKIGFKESSYIKAMAPWGQEVEAYGTYDPSSRQIDLSSNADNIHVIGGATVLHEIGHHVHLAKLTDSAAQEWNQISDGGKHCLLSAYGRTNQGEHFAEAYRAYSRGGDYRKKLKNMEPDSYAFMRRVFSGKNVLPDGQYAVVDWSRYQ